MGSLPFLEWDNLDVTVYILVGLYAVILLIPAIQLFRIYLRAPELGWTTQKLFLFLTLISSLIRCIFFALVPYINGEFFMENFEDDPIFTILDTLPGVLFFSTYTLLVLFWAEIIHHARNQSLAFPQRLRPIFMTINMIVYLTLIMFWLLLFFFSDWRHTIDIIVGAFMAAIFLGAAAAFIVYGGRLYMMLKQFPIESLGRRTKLKEVGWVTVICTTCFTIRAAMVIYVIVNTSIDKNDVYIFLYYLIVEIIPSLLVLYILRKLPPKAQSRNNGRGLDRSGVQYHPIQ
mmetsp:Transcript_22723/g.31649  ORF Transcript_22723/g.31649 Transcript_22723/m.31649 type:complete len:288 (+) Transcript_22723:93-956(+)